VIIDPRCIDTELTALIRQRHARFCVIPCANRTLVTHVNCESLRLPEVLASARLHHQRFPSRNRLATGYPVRADSITLVTKPTFRRSSTRLT
jgi:hypothetical protein